MSISSIFTPFIDEVIAPNLRVAAEATKKATIATCEWTLDTAVPAIAHATEVTLKATDRGCRHVNNGTIEFLKKYPGIAMTLSPSSIIKMVVANHVDAQLRNAGPVGSRPSVVIDMTLNNNDSN